MYAASPLLLAQPPVVAEVGAGQSGPLGLLVVVLLCVAAVFLFRSLRTQLRRVPPRFDDPNPPPAPDSSHSEAVSPPDERGGA